MLKELFLNIQGIAILAFFIWFLFWNNSEAPQEEVQEQAPQGEIPRSQWPPKTARVAEYQWNALGFFLVCMNGRRGETDFLGRIEREQYFHEALMKNPDITWGELISNAMRDTKPVK